MIDSMDTPWKSLSRLHTTTGILCPSSTTLRRYWLSKLLLHHPRHRPMLGGLMMMLLFRSITMISFGSRCNLVVEICLKRVFLSRLTRISVLSQISEKNSLMQLLLSLVLAGSGSSVRNSTSFSLVISQPDSENGKSWFSFCFLKISVKREEKRLEVVKTSNAINPLVWDDIVSRVSFILLWNFFLKLDVASLITSLFFVTANHQLGCVGGNISPLFPHTPKKHFRNKQKMNLLISFVFLSYSAALLLSGLQGKN